MSLDIKIISLCILMLPFALATGPFLPDLIASIVAIFFLYSIFKYKNYDFLTNKIFIVLFIFNIYIILRSLISENILLSLESSLFYFRFLLFSFGVAFLVNKNKQIFNNFSYCIIFAILFVVLDAFFQLLFGRDIFGVTNEDIHGSLIYNGYFSGQLTGIFGDEKILGSYLARMMPLAFAFVIFLNKKRYNFLFIFLIIASDVAIYLSGERTAFFLLIFSFLLIFILTKKWKIIRLISFIISIILIIIITLLNTTTRDRMFVKTANQLGFNLLISNDEDETNIDNNDIEQNKRLRVFSSHHENHYIAAFKMFKENIFFGIGPKLFRVKCSEPKYKPFSDSKPEDVCSTHPHNTYIQLLSETGIVGFLLIFPFFILICYKFLLQFVSIIFYKKYAISDIEICILVSLFVFTFPFIPTGSVFNNWLSVIHFLALGFYLGISDKNYEK